MPSPYNLVKALSARPKRSCYVAREAVPVSTRATDAITARVQADIAAACDLHDTIAARRDYSGTVGGDPATLRAMRLARDT